jgi:hypothetical protein
LRAIRDGLGYLSMDLNEFRQEFLNETAAWAESDKNFRHASFVDVAVRSLEEAGEVADFEPCYYRGTGLRRRALAIDGYAFDDADGSLRLFLADPALDEPVPTLTQSDARGLFARLRAVTEEAIEGRLATLVDPSTPIFAFATELNRRLPQVSRVRTYLLTAAALSTRSGDWPDVELAGIPVESHIWDIARFHRLHSSRSGRDELVVDFSSLVEGGLPCIEAGNASDDYSAYLCVVPGAILADIYDEYGSRLLEGNVRSFLTTKGRINKGIRNTVLHESPMFFAYNNGIAATASSITVGRTDQGSRLLTASDLQIVNGGQTTASLAAARRQDKAPLDGVFVPMKLSVVSPERSGEMIPLISRYANSQNRVSDADFFSNHEYHRRLEQISRRVWAPAKPGAQHETHWFYERARGQYVNEMTALTAGERRRFQQLNPRDQVVTKTDLAKAENSWRQLPQVVSRGAQKNFVDFAAHVTTAWDANPDVFHENYFRAAMARVMLFRSTEKLVSGQPWYSGGYRANVVTYAVAKLARMIETQTNSLQLDFRRIWRQQGISPSLSSQLARVTEAMHLIIRDPPPGIQNVTEWSKREACWERARAVEIPLLDDVENDLCPIEELREIERAARSQQHQDSGISAQTAVVELGRGYWADLREWAQARMMLPPDEDYLVRLAAGLAEGFPTDRQSKRLLLLKARLETEGLAPPTSM